MTVVLLQYWRCFSCFQPSDIALDSSDWLTAHVHGFAAVTVCILQRAIGYLIL